MPKDIKNILIVALLMLLAVPVAAQQQQALEAKFPAAVNAIPHISKFPLLATLLSMDDSWQETPASLKEVLFPKELQLVQGSAAYPLLYAVQKGSQWQGLPVFDQLAYELEYYVFDPARPKIILHIGRPVRYDMQHGRVEALAAAEKGKDQFPFLDDSIRAPLFSAVTRVVEALESYGATKLPFHHPATHQYRLPGGTLLTYSDFSGSANGSVYIQLTLEPEEPIASMLDEHIPAFPGADGYSSFTPGGRGGKVYVVNTLEDYLPEDRPGREEGLLGQPSAYARTLGEGRWVPYVDALGKEHSEEGKPRLPGYPMIPKEALIPGSLRAAVEAKGPRVIVFAVSGTIELKAPLVIKNPYVTIAANTAPGSGVQLRNWGVDIQTHDVVLRYLRIRVGETKGPGAQRRVLGDQTHGLDIRGMNVMVDHCEVAYANDQILNFYGAHARLASTVQWSYIYGAPTQSTHEKGNHSMAAAANGWGWVSFHHNLIAHCERRNIRAEMLSLDYRNNVLYNYGGAGYGSPNDYIRLNYIGNVQKEGPDSPRLKAWKWGFQSESRFAQFYAENNNMPARSLADVKVLSETLMPVPFASFPLTTHTPQEAYELVLTKGGANLPVRDKITQYVARTVREGTGAVPATPDSWPNSGFATYPSAAPLPDMDGDGMPDSWEIQYRLEPENPLDAAGDKDKDGYTNIEEYINSTNPIQFVNYIPR
ncbi:hypothetical protein [Cesiribacter sp. SM1]|uniref:hypothetical protein n=1 Tax=Cesiribacter sp. SM1 TaxID=2861196 RepID=UPI001CD29639|nr:hypothetical protein [Cesiribacter sp. SM1]